jgi:hypothetical protein
MEILNLNSAGMLSVLGCEAVPDVTKPHSLKDLKKIIDKEYDFSLKRASFHNLNDYTKSPPEFCNTSLEKHGSDPGQLNELPNIGHTHVYNSSTEFIANLDKSVQKEADFATYHRCSISKQVNSIDSHREISVNEILDSSNHEENYLTIICKFQLLDSLKDP